MKVIVASIMLIAAFAYLFIVGVKDTSLRFFTPAQLIADAQSVDSKGVQIEGLIAEGTSQWDAANFKLTFAVRDREGVGTVNVIYADKLRPDNFKDGGPVFVEGVYDAQKNLIVASKLQTKCASKYEAAESGTGQIGEAKKSKY
jgi:cytochrome c-type biogenesis protein CcmE